MDCDIQNNLIINMHYINSWINLILEYTRYHEMPQKACERGFCHVIAFSQFIFVAHLIEKIPEEE